MCVDLPINSYHVRQYDNSGDINIPGYWMQPITASWLSKITLPWYACLLAFWLLVSYHLTTKCRDFTKIRDMKAGRGEHCPANKAILSFTDIIWHRAVDVVAASVIFVATTSEPWKQELGLTWCGTCTFSALGRGSQWISISPTLVSRDSYAILVQICERLLYGVKFFAVWHATTAPFHLPLSFSSLKLHSFSRPSLPQTNSPAPLFCHILRFSTSSSLPVIIWQRCHVNNYGSRFELCPTVSALDFSLTATANFKQYGHSEA